MSGSTRLRVAFFGSPAFAVETLNALHEHHDVALVVTQPDRRAGRGMRLHAPAAATRARELGLRLEQPTRLRGNEEFVKQLVELDLDVAITAAYGRILPGSLLKVPRHGFLNVHASLLPAYRGAAPVQWALIRGERETGVSIMQTDEGLDTGPVRLRASTEVAPGERAGELLERLATLGASTLIGALELLGRGELPLEPQDDSAATLAPPLKKEDGYIRWEESAEAIENRFRGVHLWPGTSFEHDGQRVQVLELSAVEGAVEGGTGEAAGTILKIGGEGVTVASGEGAVRLELVRAPGRRALPARDWANGRQLKVGERLG